MIHDLEEAYFYDVTAPLVDSLTKDPARLSCLNDPSFIKTFKAIVKKHDIVEYYLLDEFGSFILLDKSAKLFWLAVVDEAEMDHLLEMAEEYHEESGEVPASVLKALKEKKKMPFYYFEEEKSVSPKDWGDHLYPVECILGREKYYYTLIRDLKLTDMNLDKILSYRDFLKRVT